MESLEHQLKDRQSKLHTYKAEVHLMTTKDHTSVPKIDPLSREIAKELTKRELKDLGVAVKESPKKPKRLSIPAFKTPKVSVIKSPKPKIVQKPSRKSSEAAKPNDSKKLLLDPPSHPTSNKKFDLNLIKPEDLNPVAEQINIRQLKRKKTLEMIGHLDEINSIRDELNKEYPELNLNISMSQSSFHSNDLSDLNKSGHEDHTVDFKLSPVPHLSINECIKPEVYLGPEKTETEDRKIEERNEGVGKVGDEDRNTEVNQVVIGNNERAQVKDVDSGSSLRIEERKDTKESSSKFLLSPIHSKVISINSEYNSCLNRTQSLYFKASFLHSGQDSVKSSVPRCHIDLMSGQTSPIYYNVRLHGDSKVKTPSGIGSAQSLRRLLLDQTEESEPLASVDTYSKNLAWAQQRDEKLKKIRECIDLQETQKCTFSPFPAKKKTVSQSFLPKSKMSSSSPSIDFKDTIMKISEKSPEDFILYTGLSPTNQKLGFPEGCNIDKMTLRSKPLLSYKQINLLSNL